MTICKRIMCCLAFFTCCASYTWAQTANPYVLIVGSKPYLLRSYLMFEGKKRTHVISVGTPEKVSYSYDLKQGALLQVWRGQFIDVTEMWKDRGEPQLAKPLGTVLPLSDAPAIAALADKDAAWPDSVAFDDLRNEGYVLDKNKMPTFIYSSNDAEVSDQIAVQNGGGSIDRTLSISNSNGLLYCRIAAGPVIEVLKDNTYSVGNKAYTVKVPADAKAFIRKTKNGQELLAPLAKGTSSLTYSLIW
ncbi:MAG TPA: hypothetical protein VK541_09095 [Pedobacter sp.]|uniref:hypothetical protein n=1 Tax=Pedobacter sp. TaxID=1411316 RepID=UPI002C17A73F|nr:hypothetical protein [Pedobacter sp.]HMI02624.1 hypothetical protein [Pedobacter sp.]